MQKSRPFLGDDECFRASSRVLHFVPRNDVWGKPSFLHPGQLAKLYGKERLLSDEEVVNLQVKALNLKIGAV